MAECVVYASICQNSHSFFGKDEVVVKKKIHGYMSLRDCVEEVQRI